MAFEDRGNPGFNIPSAADANRGVDAAQSFFRNVLLVDDDAVLLHVTARILQKIGCRTVFKAQTPSEALGIWSSHRHEIDLVISDYYLPGVSGDELIARFRGERPELPGIVLSGSPLSSLSARIPLVQGVNFLSKPFTRVQLEAVLRNCTNPLATASTATELDLQSSPDGFAI